MRRFVNSSAVSMKEASHVIFGPRQTREIDPGGENANRVSRPLGRARRARARARGAARGVLPARAVDRKRVCAVLRQAQRAGYWVHYIARKRNHERFADPSRGNACLLQALSNERRAEAGSVLARRPPRSVQPSRSIVTPRRARRHDPQRRALRAMHGRAASAGTAATIAPDSVSGAAGASGTRSVHSLSRVPIAPHRFRHTAPVRGPPLVSSQLKTAHPPSAGAVSKPAARDVTNDQPQPSPPARRSLHGDRWRGGRGGGAE
jgi:hypothetical protein